MANSLPDFTRISQPFAVSGNRSSIPQTTTGTNAASFQDGFPPITSTPLPDGGMPPKREDFNALGYISTSTLAFLQQGGLFTFDTAISNLIGGYPQGAVLNYIVNNKVYRLISLVNNNTYNFNRDSSYIGQYWDYVNDNQSTGGGMQMGTIFPFVASQPPVGAYLLNGQTIYNCATLYPDFWSWLNGEISANRVRSVSASVYQQEIIQYGICNAFVVSGNDVRLPLWIGYQTPLGNSVPVVGDGKSLGLTDGEENNGITVISSGITPRPDAYGVNVGTATTTAATTFTAKLALGVTTDADNSGLIADTSGYTKDGFYWCIQVFNAATELSTQESAQLASQMQMKAQTDLANVTANLDFVVESYNDNAGNWYRKYRSGWIEQGGFSPNGTAPTVTFLQPFSDTNYTLIVGGYVNTSVDTGGSSRGDFASNKTTTTFRVSQITGWNTNWYACGF